MDEQTRARRHLEQDLRHAVERGELVLHYQPLVSCRTGEVEGFEALVRWQHPRRGLLMPAEFIGLAEATGQIVRIGEWVLKTACETAAGWEKPYWVSVNFSPVQFRQAGLARMVAATLASSGLPPGQLEIEVTENVLIENVERAMEVLSALRALGARVALDDFGTGYSSLSYLRSFAFDKLKIDRSFISDLGHDGRAAMIVRTIIGLAHNLGLSIVAEGGGDGGAAGHGARAHVRPGAGVSDRPAGGDGWHGDADGGAREAAAAGSRGFVGAQRAGVRLGRDAVCTTLARCGKCPR